MSAFFNGSLSSLKPYTPGEQPKNIPGLIKLNTNESPFPPSPEVEKALRGAADSLRLYSDPDCAGLKSAAAETLGVKPENISPGNGSDEILAFLFCGFCERGAAFPDITYGFYEVFAGLFGVKKTIVPLGADFCIEPETYAGIKSTLFIANPNAPTGIFLPPQKIERILAQDSGRLVVVDEAYIDFGGESAVPLLDKYKNLVVVRTLSKSRSLAGGRVGFAAANEDIIRDIESVRYSFNPYNVNTLSLLAGECALRDKEYFDFCRARIIKNREILSRGLAAMGFYLTDSRANFVFAGRNPVISGEDFFNGLRARGILVRSFPGGRTGDFVRITVGDGAQVEAILCAAEQILKEKQNEKRVY